MTRHDKSLTVELSDTAGTFSLHEICERGGCHAEFVIKLVNYGVIAPVEETTESRQWQFDLQTLARLRKAMRLQRDLKMNLPGLAMSLELLDEVQDMRRELDRLHRQLEQFMEKP
ncbi:chaperone modulator CbpM [Marinobacter sp. CHS3-4]|uniref:chaperone modulator CbpM n=1 Tax=Marinobacter sp. CHS3-4 TaxID=3045174 RepID=UPI0024B49CE4|nr:chaperone modulator CbpM [Marinobacter sp. CHS3-4]MDI9244555.1 chaperone modulator CbpM [Marinobacter sp. CHS3-4]